MRGAVATVHVGAADADAGATRAHTAASTSSGLSRAIHTENTHVRPKLLRLHPDTLPCLWTSP